VAAQYVSICFVLIYIIIVSRFCLPSQVMLFEEAPFETQWTMSEEQPVKKKVAKETKGKNVTFIPVPDSGNILLLY